MQKLNKYERRMMMNLHVISFLCILASALNIILPLVDNPKFTIFILSQFIAIGGIYVYGWINSRGAQVVPLTLTFILRAFQGFIFVFWRSDITWITFGVLVFMDILLIILLVIDKANYKYTYVKREDDEFCDK